MVRIILIRIGSYKIKKILKMKRAVHFIGQPVVDSYFSS